MIIAAFRSRFKKIVIAVLLLAFASWSHEGFVICYGADGHVEIERPADKDCCQASKKAASTALSEQAESPHCFDVPVGAEKYIASAAHAASYQHYSIPLNIVSPLLFFKHQPGPVTHDHERQQPHNPLHAVLKTVILLI